MTWIFTTIIYKPLLNVLVILYGSVAAGDLGVAIILMTLLIRALSLPLSLKTLRSQREMAELGPEMEKLKERHKGDQAAQGQAMMELYKQRNINPLGGCLPLLIQIPVLLGLYRVFLNVFKPESLQALYSFVPNPETIQTLSFGVLDLGLRSIPLALAAGAAQFIHALLSRPAQQTGQAAMLSKQMLYFFPLMIIVVSWNLPAGLALYWVVSTLLSIGEQWYIKRSYKNAETTA
jgi:YidC/Oxa1 family membrane protein insertase